MGSQEAHYVPLVEARPYVLNHKDFIAPNASGIWYKKLYEKLSNLYIVRVQTPESYEITLFIYDEGVERWFENTTEYSTAIRWYKGQLHPHTETILMDGMGIVDLIMAGGYKQLAKRRINGQTRTY